MALKIQYNKTFSQELSKQLTIRERALPTLKSKETALRIEVKKAKDQVALLDRQYKKSVDEFAKAGILIREFPRVVHVNKVDEEIRNIAGVKVAVFKNVDFEVDALHFAQQPAWIPMGIEILKEIITNKIALDYAKKQLKTLGYHRKKTTQKVNLYEKVQIPEYKSVLLRIKRYLEDEENLQKAAQKIVKERHQQMERAL